MKKRELDAVWSALGAVIDPELGIDIVNLGLVYEVARQGDGVEVVMTMTSPACPMGAYLRDEAHAVVQRALPSADVGVRLVWDPPWTPARMTPRARLALGAL